MTDTPPPPPGASTPPPPPPPAATPPVAPPAPAAPAAKKRSPLLWIAVGCAALVVVAFLMMVGGGLFLAKKGAELVEEFADDPAAAAMIVAENVVRINPDLELVDSDRETQTITVRNKDTGEVMSLSLEDIESGHIGFESDEGGEVSLDLTQVGEGGALTVTKDGEETFRFGIDDAGELPDWIPIYAGSEVEGIFSMVADGATNGAFTLQSDDSVKKVLDYYAGQFEDQDWDVRRSDFSSGDTQGGQLSFENEELGRGLTITATSRDQGTQAAVNYRFKE